LCHIVRPQSSTLFPYTTLFRSLHEAGIFHATATMHGEGTLPAWLVDELHHLGVTRVQIWPDRDQTGLASALKLKAALAGSDIARSEEHTSELQSRENLVCRLLL